MRRYKVVRVAKMGKKFSGVNTNCKKRVADIFQCSLVMKWMYILFARHLIACLFNYILIALVRHLYKSYHQANNQAWIAIDIYIDVAYQSKH